MFASETHESITFNDLGLCNICEQNDFLKNKIDWDKRKELDILIKHIGINMIMTASSLIAVARIVYGHYIIWLKNIKLNPLL